MYFGPWLQIRLVEIDILLLFAKRPKSIPSLS